MKRFLTIVGLLTIVGTPLTIVATPASAQPIGLLKLLYPNQARRPLKRVEAKLFFPAAIIWLLTLRQ
jgi:hypothetical protein